jgi:hypothetical protein
MYRTLRIVRAWDLLRTVEAVKLRTDWITCTTVRLRLAIHAYVLI